MSQSVSSFVATVAVAAFAGSALAGPAPALPGNTLWYSGNPNTANWSNYTNGVAPIVHWQSFVVADAAGWTIDTVFSIGEFRDINDLGEWSIRTGMSAGVGGTLVAGGTGAINSTPWNGFFSVNTMDIPDLHLAPGTYWLAVSSTFGTIAGTNGAGAVGTSPTNALRLWPNQNQFYMDLGMQVSAGVTGAVPTPGAMGLLAIGGIAASRRRRAAR